MIPAAFDYARAESVNDVLEALGRGDATKVIAGGQSLLPLLKLRLAEADRLIDIGQLSELQGIQRKGDSIRIGAATTYRAILDSDLLRQSHPIMAEVTEHIGDLQVRNSGTLGGGLAHADPASDMPAVMLALDATFTLRSQSGERKIAARGFFKGPFETAMDAHELLAEIELPKLPPDTGSSYVSFEQKASGYALVGAAAVVTMSGGKVSHAALAFAGLADTPFLAEDVGQLAGTDGGADAIETVAAASVSGVEANDDIHASPAYRVHLAEVAARRALGLAVQRAS